MTDVKVTVKKRPRPLEYDTTVRVQFRGTAETPFHRQSMGWDNPALLAAFQQLCGGPALLAVEVDDRGVALEYENQTR